MNISVGCLESDEKTTYSDSDGLNRIPLLSAQLERAINVLLLEEGRNRLSRFRAALEYEGSPWAALSVCEGVYMLDGLPTSNGLGKSITPGISREVGRLWCRTRSAEPPVTGRGRRVHGE